MRWMGMGPFEMVGMIMARPVIFRVVVRCQEAFAMMPAIAEDVIISYGANVGYNRMERACR